MFNIVVGVVCLFTAGVVRDNVWLYTMNLFFGVTNMLIGFLRIMR